MIRTAIAMAKAAAGKALANPRLTELAAGAALTVGMTQKLGGYAGWLTAGVLGMLQAWGEDVTQARRDKTASDQS